MDKYRDTAEKKLDDKKRVHPERVAQLALMNAQFSKQNRDEFFDEAFGSILVDYFLEWLRTEPHEENKRKHLYSCALALGSVKERLVGYEVYGKNVPHLGENNDFK